MFQRLLVMVLFFVFNFAQAQTQSLKWTEQFNISEKQRSALDAIQKRISDLRSQKEKINSNIDDLNGDKHCAGAMNDKALADCNKKFSDINSQTASLARNADKVQVELAQKEKEYDQAVERVRKEMADADKAASNKKDMDRATEKVNDQEKERIRALDNQTKLEFAKVGLSAQSLLLGVADSKARLKEFERNLDNSRMGLYLQIKMREMLTDSTMCDVVKQCGKGSKATLGSEALKNVFSSINEEGKPYAPYSNEGRGRGAPAAQPGAK